MKPKVIQWTLPLLVLIAGVLYMRAGSHIRLPEDEQVVWSNPAVTEPGLAPALAGHFYNSSTEGFRPAIRPVSTLVQRAAWNSFRGDRSGFQWLQILTFGLAGVLLGLLWIRLHGPGFAPLLAGLWLVVHPVSSASVLTLAGMSDLLALVFLLLSMLTAARVFSACRHGVVERLSIVVTAVLLLLAAWSRETALAGILVLACWAWAEAAKSERDVRSGLGGPSGLPATGVRAQGRFKLLLPFFLGLAVVLVLFVVHRMVTLAALPEHLRLGHAVGAATGLETGQRILTGLATVPTTLRLLLFPHPLGYSYDYLLSAPLLPLRAALGAVVLAGAVFLLVRSIRAGSRVTPWIALFLFTVIGATGIFVPLFEFDTERLLLLGLPGAIALVLHGARWLGQRFPGRVPVRGALVAGVVVAGLFAFRTVTRQDDFRDWETLVQNQVKSYPQSAEGRLDQGNLYLTRRHWAGAVTEYEEAVRLRPDFWIAWVNMGTAHLSQEEPGLAMRSLEHALQGMADKPQFATIEARAHYNRALVLMQQNRNQEALAGLQRMLRIFPDHVSSHANAGFIYSNARQYDAQAKFHLGRAMDLEKDPERMKVLEDFLTRIEKRRQRMATDQDQPSGDPLPGEDRMSGEGGTSGEDLDREE